jgi:HK97 family phage prohead protease
VRFAGYAAIFRKRDLGGDAIQPGAFRETLAARIGAAPLPVFWQHRPDRRIGWIDTLREDSRGLRVIGTLTDPAAAALLRDGTVRALSFGYRATSARATPAGRDLHAVDLFEVSLVTQPMQPLAQVHLVKS